MIAVTIMRIAMLMIAISVVIVVIVCALLPSVVVV